MVSLGIKKSQIKPGKESLTKQIFLENAGLILCLMWKSPANTTKTKQSKINNSQKQ